VEVHLKMLISILLSCSIQFQERSLIVAAWLHHWSRWIWVLHYLMVAGCDAYSAQLSFTEMNFGS
jgi:hypothetical protein